MLLEKCNTVAIGRFDGIHRGHMRLVDRLGDFGALVIIDRDDANLTPMEDRNEYVKCVCKYYPFNQIQPLKADEFLTLLKKDFPNLKRIIVGYDFRFGVGCSHGANDLKIMFDGVVEIVDEYLYDGISVHSSTIRQSIKQGDMYNANRLLGREYTIKGSIIKGQGLGKKRLYPTLNLDVERYILPKNGVYATRTCINDRVYDSVSFVGIRHSADEKFAIETHILHEDFNEVANEVKLVFVEFLRENRKYDDLNELKKQIYKDIQNAKEMLIACKVHFDDKTKQG